MKVLFTETKFWDKRKDFQARYEAKILRAAEAARKLLPSAPSDISFVVQLDALDAMPEYGSGAYTKNSRLIIISIDPGLPYGEDVLLPQARESVFHEINHASRFEQGLSHDHNDFLDLCIFEGLATVFERDYANSKPLYGTYTAGESQAWLEEITTEYDPTLYYQYMFQHKDGRKWMGYKMGTYIVDEAIKKSDKTVLQLTELTCAEIKHFAGI